MSKIFISKENEYNEQELAVIAVLNWMQNKKHENIVTSIQSIAYVMCGRFPKTRIRKDRTLMDNIRKAIDSLREQKMISILDQDGDNYVFSNKGLEVDTQNDYFVVIELWEMQKIFQNSTKPFTAFMLFFLLIETINNKTKEWHMSQDDMTMYWGCGKGTLNKYLTELEKLKIIYVYRHKRRKADGTYHKLNNSYGRYADKDEIIKAASEYADTVECEYFYEKIDRRSIKLRYNAFCDGSKKYRDIEEVKKLYTDCLRYNKSVKNNPISGTYEGEYKECGELDLSVFPKLEVDCEIEAVWGEPEPIEQFNIENIFEVETA